LIQRETIPKAIPAIAIAKASAAPATVMISRAVAGGKGFLMPSSKLIRIIGHHLLHKVKNPDAKYSATGL
jgi:hypothetical protein